MVKPWYKQFWPWVLISLPASAVIGSLVTILLAVHEPDGLVVDDYYKQGLAINQDIARQRAAEARGLNGEFSIDLQHGKTQLSLNQTLADIQELKLRLAHPTRAHKDLSSILTVDAQGRLSGLISSPEAGRWQVIVEPQDGSWRLTGQIYLPEQTAVKLYPG